MPQRLAFQIILADWRTKMAKGAVKPFMMSVEKAVDHLQICIKKKSACHTAPRYAIPLVKFRRLMMRIGGK